ncbi:acyl-CoA-like ligand-binding transcription factor [Nocardia rhamnosiphila]|uniref:acyl-CoA-like ligand-binding transcription factor n=2 Tax=Nocardia rhamnosiphila TaxID=426716 RepID=UPI00068A91D2|nr:TetR family transcriptional regulator [Nocardia rhamnosiphila]
MTGLRELKKERTRLAIQEAALRLFARDGYENTTVKQIAAAAEVAERTFFRYFPTKEDVVAWDTLDLSFAERFHAQPATVGAFEAVRATLKETFTDLPPPEQRRLRERVVLMTSVPPLRAMLLDQLVGTGHTIAQLVADRTGADPGDPAIRALVGAVVGAAFAAVFAVPAHPDTDFATLIGETLDQLSTIATDGWPGDGVPTRSVIR